jgi:hypothetical protein
MQHEAIAGIETHDSKDAQRRGGTSALPAAGGTVSVRILNAFLRRGK